MMHHTVENKIRLISTETRLQMRRATANATYRSSSFNIMFFSLIPCELFQLGFKTSFAYAPSNHAVFILNSILVRHLKHKQT